MAGRPREEGSLFVGHKSTKILDVLISQGKVKADMIDTETMKNLDNWRVEEILRDERLVTSEDLAKAYSQVSSLLFVSLKGIKIPKEVLAAIPEKFARYYNIIPYALEGKDKKILKVAVGNPGKLSADLKNKINQINTQKGIEIRLAIITPDDFNQALSNYLTPDTPPKEETPAAVSPLAPEEQKNPTDLREINLKDIVISSEVISKFPEDIARKYKMVVFEAPHPSFIKVAVENPEDKKMREILNFVKDNNDIMIEEYLAKSEDILAAMRFYKKDNQEVSRPVEEKPVEKKPAEEKFIESEPIIPTVVVRAHEDKSADEVKPYEVKKKEEPVPEIKDEGARNEGELTEAPVSTENDLETMLSGENINNAQDLEAICQSGQVPKMVAAIIALAATQKSSDIHIEPAEKNIRIRYRIDGILRDIIILPLDLQPAIVSRIKILSNLKIDESRIPQDGRFDVTTQGHAIDLRISTLPTVHGEKLAMRLLDKSAQLYTLEELGLAGRGLKVLTDNIDKPFGIILSTGPTGSGKSTTLYAILNRISTASVNIITLEDPVEYEIPGTNQCQIKPKIGFTFANGLRSVLRQDPNVIMVGEIRDAETASLAVHAALTGHLVLSTLHTNDASGALPRLINMGIEPFLITSSINCIVAQRLVRKLCPKCKVPAHIPELVQKDIDRELAQFNFPKPYKFFEGRGCGDCSQGYKGRIGIFEVMGMNEEIENLTISRRPSSELKAAAIKNGMVTMKQDGLIKALKGQTSINEVLRVVTI